MKICYKLNEDTREPTIICQPSINTNSSILKGSEIIAGGSIIIPIDIRVEETTKSITRKGINSINPIWKARVSSLIIKAGSPPENPIAPDSFQGLFPLR